MVIDTSYQQHSPQSFHSTPSPYAQSPSNSSSLNPFQASTSFSAGNSEERLRDGPQAGGSSDAAVGDGQRVEKENALSKGKLETRKLLLHLLKQLRRAMAQAPSVFDASGAGGGKGKGEAAQSDSEDDEGDILRRRKSKVPDWGSLCFELMVQLRDVLRVSELRGWNLFMSR